MEQKQKILLCGDVGGRFNALFSRVEAINNKSGPFECLFCVGDFFSVVRNELEPYKIGAKKVPIPTYILGPNNVGQVNLYPDNDAMELCSNLYCLGKRGVYTVSGGLKVGYLSGVEGKESNKHQYTNKDLEELYNACVRGNASFRGLDILLTSQWPNGITNGDLKMPKAPILHSSNFPSWMVMKLKPRYHISGLEGVHYERAPFRAPNLGDHDTTLDLATRFVGLARVANPNKDKWLYALSLTPLDKMRFQELMERTTDETSCPFDFALLDRLVFNRKKAEAHRQYFYDTNAPPETTSAGPSTKRQKFESDPRKCWFCLSNKSVNKDLVITVGYRYYIALAKGGIVDEHVVICPLAHYQNSLQEPYSDKKELNKMKQSVRKYYDLKGQVPVFFERNYKTWHTQLHVVPIPKAATRDLKETFMDKARAHGVKLKVLDSHNRLNEVLQDKVPFFTAELPNGDVLYTQIRGAFPINFGREVLVSGPVLNMPDRLDWKDCILAEDELEVVLQPLQSDLVPWEFED